MNYSVNEFSVSQRKSKDQMIGYVVQGIVIVAITITFVIKLF